MPCCRSLVALLVVLLASPAARADTDARAQPPKATLYAFFATWCVPCRVEIPYIERLHRTYAERGLKVVLVSEDAPSTAANVPSFLARFDVTANWVLDNESELLSRYNQAASVPFTAVVDATGAVVYAHAGYEPGDEQLIERAVMKALATSDVEPEQRARRTVRVRSSTQALGVWRESKFDDVVDGRLRAAVARVEVSGRTETLEAMVRVDGAMVDDAVAAVDDADDDARLERVSVGYQLGPVRLQGGDDYVAFGHGVSLSLRKVDPLGLDTSLQGGRVDYENRRVRATLLGGRTNPQNIDPLELRVVDDVNDVIVGSEVSVDLGAGKLAPYALYARAQGASASNEDV